jgi:hypothetical protein
MVDARKILRAQTITNHVALVQAAKFFSYIIDHVLAVRFGDISLGGHGHDDLGPERFPFEHAAAYGLATENSISSVKSSKYQGI